MSSRLTHTRSNIFLFLILAGSFLLKNPFWTQPFIEHFGSYQSIVGMIAYEFARQDFKNFLYPNSMILTEGGPSLEMIYHPLSSFFAAVLWKIFGGSLDYWGRFQSMFFSALATGLLYLSVKRIAGEKIGLWASFLFAFAPMSLIYGRTFMNESIALFLLISSFLLLQLCGPRQRPLFAFLSGILFSLVLILRLHFIVAWPAFLLYLILNVTKKRVSAGALFTIGTLAISSLWFWHTNRVTISFPHVHTSLFAQIEARHIPDPLLFQGIFYEKVAVKAFLFRLLGPIPILLLLCNLGRVFKRDWLWVGIFFLSTFGLIILWPSKFYDHQFYLMPLLLPGALLAAISANGIGERFKRKWVALLVCSILVSNVLLTLKPSFTRPPETGVFFEAVKFVGENTTSQDRLMTSHGSSSDLLYYARRYGHTLGLGGERSQLTKFLKSRSYSKLSTEELNERDQAFRDTITWFEYLRSRDRIHYYVVAPKTRLVLEPAFKKHIDLKYRLLSPPDSGFALYDLGQVRE